MDLPKFIYKRSALSVIRGTLASKATDLGTYFRLTILPERLMRRLNAVEAL